MKHKMKHTAGNWETKPLNGIVTAKVAIVCDGKFVAQAWARNGIKYSEAECNAKLIAAAPDLLEALMSALPYLSNALGMNTREKAEQAILKATQ